MRGDNLDVNAALVRKVKELSADAKAVFRDTFPKAPLMLSFFSFLEKQKDEKFRTQDAVQYLYGIKNSHSSYTQYENRFFKLRKKLYDHFQASPVDTNFEFTPHEAQLNEIKKLTLAGNYQQANVLLIELEKNLWRDNIFELIPDVLDLLMHNNQVQRRINLNEELYKRLDSANEILSDLTEAKKLARQIYDYNFTRGIGSTTALFNKLQRISINRKEYPRFKLIYNLISATCKLGGGGLDFKPDFKVTSRFISVIKQIHTRHPNMPDYRFIAGYTHLQNYLFANLEVMNYFNAFQFRDAADLMKTLYDSVVAEGSQMQRMKGDVFYTSTASILNAGGRHTDALEVIKSYITYLTKANQTEKLLNAYMEIINTHLWLHPVQSGYSSTFISDKLEEYIRGVKNKEYAHYFIPMAHWHKIRLHLNAGQYTEAKQLLKATDFSTYFMQPSLRPEVENTILLLEATQPAEQKRKLIQEQLSKLKTLRFNCTLPPDYMNYTFLEKQLNQQLKQLTSAK